MESTHDGDCETDSSGNGYLVQKAADPILNLKLGGNGRPHEPIGGAILGAVPPLSQPGPQPGGSMPAPRKTWWPSAEKSSSKPPRELSSAQLLAHPMSSHRPGIP